MSRVTVTRRVRFNAAVDHKNFNLDVPFMRDIIPTSENIIVAFWKILDPQVKPGKLAKLVLWETENNYVEYTG